MSLDRKLKEAFDRHATDVSSQPGAWTAVEQGLRRSHKKRAVLAASGVVLAIIAAAVVAPRIGPPSLEELMASGHYIAMPERVTSSTVSNGGVNLVMMTNLPEGTRVLIEFRNGEPNPYGAGGFEEVSQGRFDYQVGVDCALPPEVQSRTFTIKLIAAPFRYKETALQPQSVYDELGPNFERLDGAQVGRSEGEMGPGFERAYGSGFRTSRERALIAEVEYEWPPDKCEKALKSAGMLPDVCTPTSSRPADDEGGANLNVVAGSVVSALTQLFLCDLYNYGTEELKAAEPWLSFRDRTKAWLEAHRPLARSAQEWGLSFRITRMSTETIGGTVNSPSWIEVDYTLRGEKVAHARFVASLRQGGFTRWEISELQLL